VNRLTLNLGLRLDIARGYNPEQVSPGGRFSEARTAPKSRNILSWENVAPRINAIYDVKGDGKFAIKGNYSRYYHQIPVDWIDFENFSGYGTKLFLWSDPNGDGVFQPGEEGDLISVSGGAFGPGGSVANSVDPNFKRPVTDEFSIGLDTEFARNWLLSVDLIYRKDKDIQEDANLGVPFNTYIPVTITDPGPDGVLGTSDDGGPITVFNQDPATFGQDQFVLTNPPGIDSDYKGIELQLTKRLSDRWQMIAGLTFGRANGFAKGTAAGTGGADNGGTGTLFDSPNSLINADGRSFWDRPVIFKLSGTYQAPYDIILAGFFRAQSGQPFPRTLFIDPPLNQGNVTIYAEPIGSRRLPSVYTVDLRVEKRIPISHGALGLSLDVFNIFNANTLLEADNLSGPTYLRPRTILAPRVARLGIRYDF
jgi:hypothetical protein